MVQAVSLMLSLMTKKLGLSKSKKLLQMVTVYCKLTVCSLYIWFAQDWEETHFFSLKLIELYKLSNKKNCT